MEKKSKGKLIALICSLVVVVGLVTTGIVLAATGVFSGSGKKEAFDLLAQAPEKLTSSAMNEQLGVAELYEAMFEKGMDLDFKLSDVKTSGEGTDLTDFSIDFGAQVDLANKKAGGKFSMGKDGANVSGELYASLEEKKIAFSLPELIKGKAFAMTANDAESKDALESVSAVLAVLPDLQKSFGEYIKEQGDALYEETECTGISNGYRLTIKKEAMDEALNQLRTYINEQQDSIGTIEEKLGMSKGSISAAVSLMIPSLTTYTKDFTFEVYGEDGELTGISTNIEVEGVECKISATCNENGDQSEANVTIDLLQNGTSMGTVVYAGSSKKGDVCEDVRKVTVSASGSELAAYEARETLDVKNNNAFEMHASAKVEGEDVMTTTASGSIKNLEPGKCMTLQYDEVNMEQNSYGSSTSMSYKMEATLAVLDGGVKAVSGEEVAVTPDNIDKVLDSYTKEVEKNMSAIVKKWGINPEGLGASMLPMSPYMNYTLDDTKEDSTSSSASSDSSAINSDDDDEDHGEYDEDDYSDEDDSYDDDEGYLDDSEDDSDASAQSDSDLDDMF